MHKYSLAILITALWSFSFSASLQGSPVSDVKASMTPKQDTLERQLLVNGRIWRNNFLHIDGHQFLFSKDFLPGTVTINGKTFSDKNIRLKYDICNDELLTMTASGTVVQLNKELVDYFTLDFGNKIFRFKRLEENSINNLTGYVQVLYTGMTPLYIKHKKEVRLRTSVGEKDTFIETYRLLIVKDKEARMVKNKAALPRLLEDHREEMKNFLRSNKLHASKTNPDGFVPALTYYDSL